MAQFQRMPCPHCRTLNLAQDPQCLHCGKPLHGGTQKTVMMAAPQQRLNGRQKAFLRRYVLPLALFVPLYCLLIVLFKFPSMNVIDWLSHPVYRPRPGWLNQRLPMPWWLVLILIDAAITRGILYFIKPVTWED